MKVNLKRKDVFFFFSSNGKFFNDYKTFSMVKSQLKNNSKGQFFTRAEKILTKKFYELADLA